MQTMRWEVFVCAQNTKRQMRSVFQRGPTAQRIMSARPREVAGLPPVQCCVTEHSIKCGGKSLCVHGIQKDRCVQCFKEGRQPKGLCQHGLGLFLLNKGKTKYERMFAVCQCKCTRNPNQNCSSVARSALRSALVRGSGMSVWVSWFLKVVQTVWFQTVTVSSLGGGGGRGLKSLVLRGPVAWYWGLCGTAARNSSSWGVRFCGGNHLSK